MDHELVKTRRLLQKDEMTKIVAIAQMTPGPIAVNGATFVGYRVAGVGGALLASAVVVSPAIAILALVMCLRSRVRPSLRFLRLRRGLRAGVLSLLLFAIWSYGQAVVTGPAELAVAIAAFLILTTFERKVHPLAVILGSGLLGLLIF
jgi:chromate transporter